MPRLTPARRTRAMVRQRPRIPTAWTASLRAEPAFSEGLHPARCLLPAATRTAISTTTRAGPSAACVMHRAASRTSMRARTQRRSTRRPKRRRTDPVEVAVARRCVSAGARGLLHQGDERVERRGARLPREAGGMIPEPDVIGRGWSPCTLAATAATRGRSRRAASRPHCRSGVPPPSCRASDPVAERAVTLALGNEASKPPTQAGSTRTGYR